MQKYEMLILLKSDLEEEAKEAELKKYAEIVTSMGGSVEATDKWGVKKLAYPIAFKADAFYALMTFVSDGAAVKELRCRRSCRCRTRPRCGDLFKRIAPHDHESRGKIR